ncbi:superfamily II DNA or RNA helicase [Kibdelosporangium banguiense]|uniref:Superfamily II DNA or RNA helicase n=1 Tax=Kibdelosporangium banguiense TaxID=1365924 RepID=A0ABS4THI7_9PSEU|nr:SNF2-related protein [Kibdelosporangium banguiense]MBP2323908.1 superfamily II DNA or RNA helicase [Kibdelosporangium banguiense]
MTSEWEQSLGSLLSPDQDLGGASLGIELTLATEPLLSRVRGPAPGPTIFAKVVRQGRNGWVGSGLSWGKLGPFGYNSSHVRLLQQMYALYRSQESVHFRDDRVIDLSRFDSRYLWTFLDEAQEIGVQLVHAQKRFGAIDGYGSAQICLDAQSDDDLVVTPCVRVEHVADAVPLRFIGDGHGFVYVRRAELVEAGDYEDCRIGLARLDRQAPQPLQDMILADRQLVIPARERPRFVDRYYPKLRHMAEIVSSDGSFTPPVISEPRLVLSASYLDEHDLELVWEWVYQIGEKQVRASLDAEPGPYRDLAMESDILARLTVEPVDRFLRGVDTMQFTTEVLPMLAEQVEVDIAGVPAEYREAGDSVQIGVSTEEIPGQTDWFDLGVNVTVEGRTIPFMDVFLALSKDKPYLLLPDGAYFSLQKPELRALHKLIIEARALLDQPTDSLKISRFQAGLWDELVNIGVVERQARAWRRQVHGLLSLEEAEQVEIPAMPDALLRPYQVTGFQWLAFLWENKLGGVLADDMGLGKTLQTLALICHARKTTDTPFLVVAPTSVVSNWEVEAARFTPDLKVMSISDTMRRRKQDISQIAADADVVVTSYTLLRLDFDAYAKLPWAGLVLDEAQVVKNHQSKVYQCARRLPAPFKLAITGTPMENNLMELWSLLSITAPGLFPDPVRFQQYYARRIERVGDPGLLAQLRRRVRPLVKRRTKEQVAADLPAKQEQILEVELHPRHRKVYQTHLQRERQRVLGMVDEDMNKNRFTIFRSLTMLRQLSLHPALMDEQHRDLPCAKIDALLEQLRDVVEGGHRALVFSQFTSFLDIVRKQLDAAGIPYSYLDGSTRDRGGVVAGFKEGATPVFLISLKAGGFGLNLTEADYCFILDPWWNPATEAQAVDRTHRIGQTRNVMVYRLIAKDTIEEKVMALKSKKAELFTSVMDDGAMFGSALNADDIRMLFG